MNPITAAPGGIKAAASELPSEFQKLVNISLHLCVSVLVLRCFRVHADAVVRTIVDV